MIYVRLLSIDESQRSVVILTHLPYPALFTVVISRLAPLYFEHGTTMLETACHNIANWFVRYFCPGRAQLPRSSPTPGSTFEIGFLGGVHTIAIPQNPHEPQFIETSSFGDKFDARQHILASIPPLITLPTSSQSPGSPTIAMTASQTPSILSLCRPFLPSLWSIWECLILSEPILVFAPSPSLCSVLIWWFRDLVRPVRHSMTSRLSLNERSYLSPWTFGRTSLSMTTTFPTSCLA